MSMIAHLQRLFAYNDWANREVLRVLPSAPARSLELLTHIFSAERLWWERIRGVPQSFAVWPNFTLEQCAQQAEHVAVLWHDYLATLPETGLGDFISYRNTVGESFRSTVEDILMHVYTHSAYHRGQIASNMRETGGTPAYTDFIHSIRQGFVK